MGHEDRSDAGATLPTPARAPATDVASARAWIIVRGRVSGLLLALREAELEHDALLPAPLAGGAALRAWALVGPTSGPEASRAALGLVGRAARVLGTRLCVLRSTGIGDLVTAVLRQEAAVHGCTPERLVAEVARAHGVLSAPDPRAAAVVWHALDEQDDPADQTDPTHP